MTGVSYLKELQQLQKKLSDLEQENLYLRKALNEEEKIEKVMNAAFHANAFGLLILDIKGVILEANQSICEMLNTNQNKIIGRNITHFVPQEHRDKIRQEISEFKHMKTSFTTHIIPIYIKDREFYIEIIISKLPNNLGFLTVIRNITKIWIKNKMHQKKEAIYDEFFSETLDGIILWKETGEIVSANDSALRIFESSYEELTHKKFSDFIYKKDEKYVSMIKNLYRDKANREELMFLMPNGQKKLLEFTTKLHSVEGLHMSIIRNISERYKMEVALLESKSMFENIFEEAFDGIIIWNEKYEIIDMNRAAERILHQKKEELIGLNLLKVLPNGKTISEDIKPMLLSLNFKDMEQNRGIYTASFKENEWSQIEFRNKYNVYSGLSITTLRDITENVVMEEQLRKSSTLNVIGELAAGIAHEIRNPMTALKGFIQLLEINLKTDNNQMYFSVIKSELDRIELIINEFLQLAKPQVLKFVNSDLTKIMNETLDLLQAQAVLYNVQFKKLYNESVHEVYCEPNQMKKVFINIIKNGIEVLDNGGEIQVKMERTPFFIHIMIQDNGKGMSKEKLARLGEPFYTTKETGTGLGLMVTYQIMEEHKGKMEIESEEGVGTTFHLYIPINKEEGNNY
ncbi:PAS domain-containing protein [Niallia sp. 01092]|uniref:PAS domain-containing protein n=1 Tax=unclassified Niallia TaxID=2837522 RepID=UPI003FD4E7E6